MKFAYVALAFASALLMAGCAHRNSPDSTAAEGGLERYMSSPTMIKQLESLAIERDRTLGRQPDCDTAEVGRMTVFPLSAIDFPAGHEHPLKGRWQVMYPLKRCGMLRMHNARFQAGPGAEPKAEYFYTGLSLASERLMRDASGALMMALAIVEPQAGKCGDIYLDQIAVSERPASVSSANGSFTGRWKETWTFRACGKLHDIGLRFEPDSSGVGTRFFAEAMPPRAKR